MSNGSGAFNRGLVLTPRGLAAVGCGRFVTTDPDEQYDRLVALGLTHRQAWKLAYAGYGFIGGAA